jgi:hypothetical protein
MHKYTRDDVDDFVEYVRAFYQEEVDGRQNADAGTSWWPEDYGPAPTDREIREATNLILEHYDLVDAHHPLGPSPDPRVDFGSHDREVARDIILIRRGYQGDREWGGLVSRMQAGGDL